MTENEFILADRLAKIKSTTEKYGEDNFRVSFSGGKDSTVLSALVDMALPGNRIPRVYADTGIELNMVRDFVYELKKSDDRIHIIKPSVPVKKMLETEGYPFKSKKHAKSVSLYQRDGYEAHKGVRAYMGIEPDRHWASENRCPKVLLYQFTPEFKLRVSDMCCVRMKEDPLIKWAKEHGSLYPIIGLMREEGGRRDKAQCMKYRGKRFAAFQPLVAVSKEWEEWFIDTYNVKICDIYKPPYNFRRTGCKGCPFGIKLQKELDTLAEFFPDERKQCEIIWKPVYDEYRRLGYRLKDGEKHDA